MPTPTPGDMFSPHHRDLLAQALPGPHAGLARTSPSFKHFIDTLASWLPVWVDGAAVAARAADLDMIQRTELASTFLTPERIDDLLAGMPAPWRASTGRTSRTLRHTFDPSPVDPNDCLECDRPRDHHIHDAPQPSGHADKTAENECWWPADGHTPANTYLDVGYGHCGEPVAGTATSPRMHAFTYRLPVCPVHAAYAFEAGWISSIVHPPATRRDPSEAIPKHPFVHPEGGAEGCMWISENQTCGFPPEAACHQLDHDNRVCERRHASMTVPVTCPGGCPCDCHARRCPDDGRCHHDCDRAADRSCWRVRYAAPLSITGWDTWPPEIVAANQLPHPYDWDSDGFATPCCILPVDHPIHDVVDAEIVEEQ
jgi:hypothetical protein